jgi:hypothetical protein
VTAPPPFTVPQKILCRSIRRFAGCIERDLWRQCQLPSAANTTTLALRPPRQVMTLPTFLILDLSFAELRRLLCSPRHQAVGSDILGGDKSMKQPQARRPRLSRPRSPVKWHFACLASVKFSSIGTVKLPLWICDLVEAVHRSCSHNHVV